MRSRSDVSRCLRVERLKKSAVKIVASSITVWRLGCPRSFTTIEVKRSGDYPGGYLTELGPHRQPGTRAAGGSFDFALPVQTTGPLGTKTAP